MHHTGPQWVALIHFTRTILIFCLLIFKDTQTFVVDRASWWQGESLVVPLNFFYIPYSRPNAERNYRAFKIQFQWPPNAGLFTWKIYIVGDTFAGEEAKIDSCQFYFYFCSFCFRKSFSVIDYLFFVVVLYLLLFFSLLSWSNISPNYRNW